MNKQWWLTRLSEPKTQWLGLFILITIGYFVLFGGLNLWLASHNLSFSQFFLYGSDQQEYYELAQNLLSKQEFIQARFPSPVPETLRTPGYPIFAAIVFTLGNSLFLLAVVQIILLAGAASLIFLLGRRFFGPKISLIGASLYCLDPAVIGHTFSMMSETLYVFLSLLGLWLFVLGLESENKKIWKLGLAGAVFGLSALTRPIILYVLPVIVLGGLIIYWSKQEKKKLAVGIIGLICAFVLVISPWITRNYLISGQVSLSSVGGYNLLFYNMAEYLAVTTGESPEKIRAGFVADLGNPAMGEIRSFKYTDVYTDKVAEIFWTSPISYLKFHLIKTIPFFVTSSYRSMTDVFASLNLWPKSPSVNFTNLLIEGDFVSLGKALFGQLPSTGERAAWLLLVLAGLSTVFMFKGQKRQVIIWWWLIVGTYAILTGPVAFPRYRLPAEPFILLLGLAGLLFYAKWFYLVGQKYFYLLSGRALGLKTEAFRYLVVGGVAFAVDYSLFIWLTAWVNWHYLVSATISFVVGLLVNYCLSIYWVFSDKKLTNRFVEFGLFSLIGGFGLLLGNVLLWLLVDFVTIHYAISKLITTVVVLGWNFGVRKWFLF